MVGGVLQIRGPAAVIAETYFRLAITVSDTDRDLLQSYLASQSGLLARGLFSQEPKFEVQLEDGSLKGWVKVLGNVVVAGLTTYGAIRAGLDYMVSDAKEFSQRVITDLKDAGVPEDRFARVERRLGIPGKVLRLVKAIEKIKRHGRDMSKKEYQEALSKLEFELAKTLEQIAEQNEAKLITKAIEKELASDAPARLPFEGWDIPVALLPRRQSIPIQELVDVRGNDKKRLRDKAYKVEKKGLKLHLRPKD